MNRITRVALVLGLLAATSVPVVAQNPASQQARQERGGAQTVIQVVLEHRQELSLTGQQVAELERIAREFHEQNAPVERELQQLIENHGEGSQTRAELRERPEFRPLFEQMRSLNLEGLRRIRAVLSEEQMALAEEHLRNSREGGRDRAGRDPTRQPRI